MTSTSISASQLTLKSDHILARLERPAFIAGGVVLGLVVVSGLLNPEQFFRSYLLGYLYWFGVALGSLCILMIQHVTGGTWGAAIRRILESATRTLPLLAVLFLPIALGMGYLYEWADPAHVEHDPILQWKALYLNRPFFLLRAVVYFAVWFGLMTFLNRWSLDQDRGTDAKAGYKLEQLSRGGLVAYVLTITFASVDWAMSLEPHWFSTIYGVLFGGGQVLTAMAFAIPILVLISERAPLSWVISANQFHDLGKLLLAFVMVWAYFSFSQFLIIWSANLPEETPWYIHRLSGGWQAVGVALMLFHFALPFVVLLSRGLKRSARLLVWVAVWMLFMRFIDLFWTITPAFSPDSLALDWRDLAALIGIGGLWLGMFARQLATRPLVPLRDSALPLEVSA